MGKMLTVGKKLSTINTRKGGMMKRKDILKKLREAGFTFKEGGDHTRAYDAEGNYRCPIGRHTEISDFISRKIEKQTGVKLL